MDGIEYINVYSKGKTKIGRFYSNFEKTPIETEDGRFNSIEALWYWILTNGKSPKWTYGYNAKYQGKLYPRVCDIDVDKIKRAIDVKIKTYLDFIIENENLDLPLQHYYQYNKNRVYPENHLWIIDHLELRRKQLKKHLEKGD